MKVFRAKNYPYRIIKENTSCSSTPFPLLRDNEGEHKMWCISPCHGRSYVVNKTDSGRFIVSKGNGLSYSQYQYLYSAEFDDYTWGMLLVNDAIRDFELGMQISEIGVKTNIMEYVLELETRIPLTNGHVITPVLLQYSVECPYRICDAPYMPKNLLEEQVKRWERFNDESFQCSHLIAANVLIGNLRKLHSKNILHNAIHIQNYTWALELLDFELACSPEYPYSKEEEVSRVKDLFNREIIQTYEIINHIAWCLEEELKYEEIDNLFLKHGFDLSLLKG